MYRFNDQLTSVKGIGPALSQQLSEFGFKTVKDFLSYLPLRYEDMSQIKLIKDLELNQLVTLKAKVISANLQYKGRNSILRAKIADESSQLNCIWFNNPHLKAKLVSGKEFFFSGKLNDRGFFSQSRVEDCDGETIHTGRLVPMYSMRLGLVQGKLRRLFKEITDNLDLAEAMQNDSKSEIANFASIELSLKKLHFPDSVDEIENSQRRLALDELLSLIGKSKEIKKTWDSTHHSHKIETRPTPKTIPFRLTTAQEKAIQEINTDLSKNSAMNRLLIGDVGSGKTVVAGVAINQVLQAGGNAALVAPTQILAEQHLESLGKIFPDLSIQLLTSQTSKKFVLNDKPCLYVGTHALLNKMEVIKPWLIIFDEQHRFGVMQRSVELDDVNSGSAKTKTQDFFPHLLTMTATPIPRSLMLTVFSHLDVSLLNEMPAGRIPPKTWVVPTQKKHDAWKWLAQEISNKKQQAIVVCPFIDPSFKESLENVAAASETYDLIKAEMSKIQPQLRLALLHSKLAIKKKDQLIKDLFAQKIDLLITTPIVEVGVDLPKASYMVIESAERFGMASLHQLRGRVGRAGQESYCLLFSGSSSKQTQTRLKFFSQETNGQKLAEQDLKNRGAGDLFGTEQHGFDTLRFASWTDFELIKIARDIYQEIETGKIKWQAFFTVDSKTDKAVAAN